MHALDGVDFTVRRGEFCAIVGTSGSGKIYTLLNMLAGLERPTRGSIVIGGQKIEHLSEEELVAFRSRESRIHFPVFSSSRNAECSRECGAAAELPRGGKTA